jgi:hypothetical protein
MDDLRQVWRVENGQGRGPYGAHPESEIAGLLQSLGYNNMQNEIRPGPAQDAGLAPYFNRAAASRDWVFGFQNLDLYREWFADKKLRVALDRHDYFLTGYAVPEKNLIPGTRQALFRRDFAAVREFRDCHGAVMMQEQAGRIIPAMQDLMTLYRLRVV